MRITFYARVSTADSKRASAPFCGAASPLSVEALPGGGTMGDIPGIPRHAFTLGLVTRRPYRRAATASCVCSSRPPSSHGARGDPSEFCR